MASSTSSSSSSASSSSSTASSSSSSSSGPVGATSVSQFLSVLIPNLVIFAIFYSLFIILRKKQKRVYEPRHIVETVPKDLQPDENPKGVSSWFTHILRKPRGFVIQQASPDGYFFLRYLLEFAVVSILGVCIIWPIIFPINATNSNHNQGFDILSFGNVKHKWRYLAHIFVSWVFFGAVIFLIYRELVYYTTFRHVLQTTPFYDSLLSSRTLLLTEVPSTLLQEPELRSYFPTATNLWYARDYKELEKKVEERTKLSNKYEGTLNKVINKAVKLRNKLLKKNKPTPEPADDLNKYLKDGKKRPTHKLKFLIGKKVDTLDYGVERLGELNREIRKGQLESGANTQIPSVFIEFPTQLELQKAFQAIPYHPELKKAQRFTGLAPDDVIWENLALTKTKRRIKKIIASTVLTLTIIFWCIPVAVVGAISNINMLTDKVPFLKFIEKMPPKIMGIITGLLPVVLLAVLMSLVPPFIKKMGKVSGCITVQQVEKYCQSWFYAFQVVNSFLVVTIASAAASVVTSIVTKPDMALKLLAQKLPAAANFYIGYVVLQGLSVTSGLLLQIVALILAQFLGKILDGTPRAKWNRWNTLGQPFFSVLYPSFQLLSLIVMTYALIAPLILGFTAIAFFLIYLAYSYTLTYVLRPNKTDARGRNYPSALFQLFVAIYLAEVVIIALFVFAKNWACVGLEVVAIVFTVAAHLYFKRTFLPLFETVPVSAIKYAAGDSTFQYPMHDQGWREIKTEGENYWQGGNQLGLTATHDQVLPDIHAARAGANGAATIPSVDGNANTVLGSDESLKHDTSSNHKLTQSEKLEVVNEKGAGTPPGAAGVAKNPVGKLAQFFKPKLQSFDLIREDMPAAYFNYIEYNEEFIKTAYEHPAVTNEEPHIWVARDEMGLSEIEKNKAIENGVDVSDDNAVFNEKGSLEYKGAPPSYEEALRV